MAVFSRPLFQAAIISTALFALAACDQSFDMDMRNLGDGLDTSGAAQSVVADRPKPDDRGVISYPGYQVAVAQRGDTIGDVAARVGLPADELARYNGIPPGITLRQDEIIALPKRVSEPSPATGAISSGPILPADQSVDITTLAGDAINRTDATTVAPKPKPTPAPKKQTGKEPIRHKIERGETAYSIARLYNVSVDALAEWNGLGSDLKVREGQYLLIPVAEQKPPTPKATAAPGTGSATPQPPSSVEPLPATNATNTPAQKPASPNLGDDRTAASGSAKLLMPVNGKIIRSFVKSKNDGIDISAPAGTSVKAAADGSVAAITRDTDQVPILVLRHADNLLTVYAGVDDVAVKKGAKVKRGQTIAKIRAGDPSFLHFEVRQGFDSVDPMPFLN